MIPTDIKYLKFYLTSSYKIQPNNPFKGSMQINVSVEPLIIIKPLGLMGETVTMTTTPPYIHS